MSKSPKLTPEILTTRLGDYLVEKKLLSSEDLERALAYQAELRRTNQAAPLLGQILDEMGLVDRALLDEAITEQILALKNALTDANQRLEQRVRERTAELEQALRKLSELNQLKSEFVDNISHELRTPLTHLKGYLELLINADLGPVNAAQTQALEVMQRSGDRLERLIEDMIQFSTLERGDIQLCVHDFSVLHLCLNQVSRTQAKAKAHQVELVMNPPAMLTDVRGDEEKISWVIMQLLDNAIKFTPPGGKVTLTLEQESKFVRVSVADTGIGIPQDRVEEIFEPFHQLDGSSTRRYAGTGLGLALVRRILEAHGSVIHVTSRVGEGSHFEFLLPTPEIEQG